MKPQGEPNANIEDVGSRPKPSARANLIHQLVLSGLVATKPTSWDHKRIDPVTGDVVKTKRAGTALANPLAGNVSEANVDRAAKRWAA